MRCLRSLVVLAAGCCVLAQKIERLDGSTISTGDAEAFARKTLADANVTGAQIAIVNRGQLAWSAAFGLRRHEPPLPMQTDTNIWAASITKSVFATYAMMLVERGMLSLDAPLAGQLAKPLEAYEAYRQTASLLVQDPKWATVTPRMLLAHTSGLANFSFLEIDNKMRLRFPPGTQYRYSGDGINLVQLLVEEKTGQKLDKLLDEAIFAPLEMTRSGMIFRTDFASNVADRYGATGQFLSQTRRFPARAAGSMTTTAEDLARFASALLTGKILKPETRAEMLKPFIQIRTLHQFALAAVEAPGEESAKVGLAYGVGWGLLKKTPFGPAFFKEGHGDGAQTYMICFERRQDCMIVLTNSDNGELSFRPLMETLFGNTVTPWEWEGYTTSYIEASRKNQ